MPFSAPPSKGKSLKELGPRRFRFPERDLGNLRRAGKPEWHTNGANAAIHIKLHRAQPEQAFNILSASRRKFERAYKREADLSSMGVSAEHQPDRFARRMHQEAICIIGLM